MVQLRGEVRVALAAEREAQQKLAATQRRVESLEASMIQSHRGCESCDKQEWDPNLLHGEWNRSSESPEQATGTQLWNVSAALMGIWEEACQVIRCADR